MRAIWTTEQIKNIRTDLGDCLAVIDKSFLREDLSADDMMTLAELRTQCDCFITICDEKLRVGDSVDGQSFAAMFATVPGFVKSINSHLSVN